MMSTTKTFLVLATVAALGATAQAQFSVQGEQPNVIVFGDFVSSNTETNGALWVGGNAIVANYSVGVDLGGVPSSHPSLVIGNNLQYSNGQVFNGSAFVGGTATTSGFNIPNGTLANTNPVDFAAIKNTATVTSASMAQMSDNFSSFEITPWNTMNLTLQSGLNIVNIDGNALKNVNTFNISGSADSTVVFNVSGTAYIHQVWAGMNENQLSGVTAEQILFNFYDASSVNLGTLSGILGSILAPNATVLTGYGSIRGQLIAQGFVGNSEFYNRPFVGTGVQPVPEPAAIAGIGVAALLALVSIRSRGRKKAA